MFPLILKNDNFTSIQRTPWAGTSIASLKHMQAGTRIGESWEFSWGPEFPSQLRDGGSLADFLRREGVDPDRFREQCSKAYHGELLVKILSASQALSIQVHPRDDDPFLKSNEGGKSESWLVLEAEPGAGLYLGFSKQMKSEDLVQALSEGRKSFFPHLQFVPVNKGDYFEIEPGVCHAIGPGVTLFEPQRVPLGKMGKTYRLWDWDRRYDAEGKVSPGGKARELHVEESLRLIHLETQWGASFVEGLRRKPQVQGSKDGARLESFPANASYQVHSCSLQDGAQISLGLRSLRGSEGSLSSYSVVTLLSGSISLASSARTEPPQTMRGGESAWVPSSAFPLSITAQGQTEMLLVTDCAHQLELG